MDTLDTLLLSCGNTESRHILRSVFEESFNILEAETLGQTQLLLKQNADCIAAVLLDLSDTQVMTRCFQGGESNPLSLKTAPVIVISETDDPETLTAAFRLGATDVIPLQYEPFALHRRVMNIAELNMHKRHMEKLVTQQAEALRHSNDAMVDALSSIIEYRSAESGHHILRIRRFTQILLEEVARCCPEYQLTPDTISIVSSAAALHDIGKISIPDAILNKPGRLTAEEWVIMKEHVMTGCRILEELGDVGNAEYLRYAHNICHYHHERWNGGGYPEGLAGDAIPICAQVVGLADAYDALTTKRVYKDAVSLEEAMNMILRGECGVFSPKLLECFKHVGSRMETVASAYADGFSPKSERFDPVLPPPKNDMAADTLNAVQKKYQSLLHYMDITAIEVDVERGLYHVLYNPYPELSILSSGKTLTDVRRSLIYTLAIPEERKAMRDLLFRDIPTFLQEGLRRQSYLFHVQGTVPSSAVPFRITLLRPSPNDETSHTLLFLCQRLKGDEAAGGASQHPAVLSPGLSLRNDYSLSADTSAAACLRDLPQLTGFSDGELRDLLQGGFLALLTEAARQPFRQNLSAAFAESRSALLECNLRHKDGRDVWVQFHAMLRIEADGRELITATLTDISAIKQRELTLQARMDLHDFILSQTQNILFDWNVVDDTIRFSNTWQKVFGYDPLSAGIHAGITTRSHFHPNDIPAFLESIRTLESGKSPQTADIRIAKADGRYLWCRFRSVGSYDSNRVLQKITGVITNIDEEKHATRALQDLAERDSLTKLLNKHTVRKQAEDYLASFPRGAQCAMLVLDLDNFKQINDQFGHLFGDAVLSRAAQEIKRLFRPNDLVARIGGDEFLILMCGTCDRKLIEGRCRQLTALFRNLFPGQLPENMLGCSIGVALSPEHSSTYTELFRQADTALYQSKKRGKNQYAFFSTLSEDLSFYKDSTSITKTRIDSDEEPGLAANNLAQYAFQRLYKSADTEAAVQEILELTGQQAGVSRVYIFENTPDNLYCNNTFEWCNTGISPEKESLQNISYETDIHGYEENFDEHGVFYCPSVAELPPHLREILEPQGIKSLLQCAIWDNGIFRGYVGFDDCNSERFWTKEQLQLLSFLADILSIFLLKHRTQEQLKLQLRDMRSIMDSQRAWIYIIDPETHRLLFLNSQIKTLAPAAKIGDCCYQTLIGRDTPCDNCPVRHTLASGNCHCALDNPRHDILVETESSLVHWRGKEAVLLSCREIRPNSDQK